MKKVLLIISILALFIGCQSQVSSRYTYQPPGQIDDGFVTGSLDEVNMSKRLITRAVERIRDGRHGEVHSMLIFRDGKLVVEEYFPGHQYQWDAPKHYGKWVNWNRDMPHCAHSVSKSIASLCIGLAVEKGFIDSVQQSIFDYLPEYQHLKTAGREYLTIEHLLTMTSGLAWDEWGAPLSSIKNDQIAIYFSGMTPVEYSLSAPLVAPPGVHFNYSGGNLEILNAILKNATGEMTLDQFSAEYLFKPLNIETFDWWLKYQTGEVHAAGGVKMIPRDMVKIGVAMLDHLNGKGRKMLSDDWVTHCAEPFGGNHGIKVPGEDMGRVGYGYTWWTKQYSATGRMFLALGWGGQKIIVIPEFNAVVVFTGGNYTSKVKQYKILKNYILASMG
jgi:CubicO group peptidase (beta-lactamase class C family)